MLKNIVENAPKTSLVGTQLDKSAFKKNSLQVLEICQQIFECAEEFYQYLAEIHQKNSETARMWSLLAIDKCNHSDTYKFAIRLKGEGIKEINIDKEFAANVLLKMKSIPKGGRSTIPTVVNTLIFAIKMEEILNSVHIRQVVEFENYRDTTLIISSLKSSSSILHLMTEEYLSRSIMHPESFDDFDLN
jgi:hypothetical protein